MGAWDGSDESESWIPIRMKSVLEGIALPITTLSGNQHSGSYGGGWRATGRLTVLEVHRSARSARWIFLDKVTVKVVDSRPPAIAVFLSLLHDSIQYAG